FFTNTTLLPGTHSSFTILNGPEPIDSVIWVKASVLATRSGIMNGTLDEGLANASSVRANGFFSFRVNVVSFTAVQASVRSASFWPSASRFDQRSTEAMQSADRTGWPSCHFRPARKVNV